MAELTVEQKREIVVALACFKRPAEVAVMMREEHDLEVEIKQIIKYDPTKATFSASDDLKVIFEATRKNFLENVGDVPIASQAYRLQILQANLDGALKSGNKVLANATLRQAAEEVGGVLTNERNLNVDKKNSAFGELTPEERRQAALGLIAEAVGRMQEGREPMKRATPVTIDQ